MGRLDGRSAAGQSTVELVLALPIVVLSLLLVLQVAIVARAQVLVVDAAREGARAAAVSGSVDDAVAAARATPGLGPQLVDVDASIGPPGGDARVVVRYRVPTDVALVGPLVGDPVLTATVVMRVEGSS
ncbi:MAG: TadE/TadG family type IV pilus assembly protein [Acidimicrobiales bacterium]